MGIWDKIRHASPKLFLYLFIASLLLAVIGLRQNNMRMIELRGQLYAADKRDKGVDEALNKLRAHVHGHMNTDLTSGGNAIKPPIQLKYTYERLQKAEQERVNRANEAIHRAANAYCRRAEPGEEFRQACFERYVNARDVKANEIEPALYQFDFASPAWSPDLAGWSLVASAVFGLSYIAKAVPARLARR